MAKAATTAKSPTKSQIIGNIAEATQLTRKQVTAVLDALTEEIRKALKGPGIFTLPGLVKIVKKKVPAQKARKGVRNPFTGEIRDIPAKPATVRVRVRPLKALKDMVK
ncbi:MAG: HU family DNA-binding protein [Thermoguttaceae bacterium]|nr:HU family DNA-binding protein [Thermoguttaceae bacterium]MDW8038757.1 HU family DNA-binding protein [Thermoguttaceae bacterium]